MLRQSNGHCRSKVCVPDVLGEDLKTILVPLGLAVRESRRARGLSQAGLAHLCGTDKASISRLEGGQSNVTLATLYKVSAVLEVSIALLLEGVR